MDDKLLNFIQSNSPDGGFLQSEYWRKFQESVGRETYNVSANDESGELVAYASIIEHTLPVAGKYFYVPRGPIQAKSEKRKAKSYSSRLKVFFGDLIDLANRNNIGWIRIEPNSEEELDLVRENLSGEYKIKKSAVDVQPKEILVPDIMKSEEEILAEMKQKTRYNIRLAEKRGVKILVSREEKYVEEFLRLVKITSERDKITVHPGGYYRRMFETIPPDILKLYAAEYKGKTIATNLVIFFGRTATYLHGASDNVHRDVMAPYLLQWTAMLDAKKKGYLHYDLGGVKSMNNDQGSVTNIWSGITKFKLGFSPSAISTKFPGSYDIILVPGRYNLYRVLQKIKRILS